MRAPVESRAGIAVRSDGAVPVTRNLPEEVPVALVFEGTTQAVMMATPLDLEDFARGFALTEGIVTTPEEIAEMEILAHGEGVEVRMWLRADRSEALKARRRATAGPVGCGLCGIDSIEAALRPLPRLPATGPILSREDVAGAAEALAALQPLHAQTRATHAAGFLLPGRGIALAREDVGRHNALDKLIGALPAAGISPAQGAAVMTSRISLELVQKCALAGIPVLIAVSAPTATALRLAEEAELTLVAFVRDGTFDIYSHPERIQSGVSHVA